MTSRRDFFKISGILAGTTAASMTGVKSAKASSGPHLDADRVGVLCDFTQCLGCRRCEWACADNNDLPHGTQESYDDTSVFSEMRRPDEESFTVINQYEPSVGSDKPFHTKVNCLHCEHPACVSACIVGALEKNPHGPVTYDAWKCIGCRYCMIACPFQIPAYEYGDALTPRVMKCSLCAEKTLAEGGVPACVKICPQEAMVFGRRDELLKVARDRIATHPGRYNSHIYGEHEAGGTSWLYLADRPFTELDLPELGTVSPAVATEAIQHGIFRGFSGPIMLFGLISVIMKSAGKYGEAEWEDSNE